MAIFTKRAVPDPQAELPNAAAAKLYETLAMTAMQFAGYIYQALGPQVTPIAYLPVIARLQCCVNVWDALKQMQQPGAIQQQWMDRAAQGALVCGVGMCPSCALAEPGHHGLGLSCSHRCIVSIGV